MSRRALLGRTAVVGALALLPGLACGDDDAAVFGTATTASAASNGDGATDTSLAVDTADDGSATTTAGDAATTATIAAAPGTGSTATTGVEMVVSFTFSPSGSGRVRNPYVAVWVEDGDGNLVDTVALWYEQGGKGSRWLSDLRGWFEASGGDTGTVTSGATRSAGDYSVVWDGTDADGNAVPAGDYVVHVEAAREHGPYEISSATVTIGQDGGSWVMDDADELTNLSVELAV